MDKDKTMEEGRAKDGKFLPNHKLQKRKKPISIESLEEALTDEASKQNLTLVRHAVRMAYTDNVILKALIDKFVPTAQVKDADIKPIQIIIERYYQAKEDRHEALTDKIDVTIPLAKSNGDDTYKM